MFLYSPNIMEDEHELATAKRMARLFPDPKDRYCIRALPLMKRKCACVRVHTNPRLGVASSEFVKIESIICIVSFTWRGLSVCVGINAAKYRMKQISTIVKFSEV